ncbi:polysaccharide biosynthesis/export family protein [Pyxidicoccus parkwayensis]|uniref:Polysaccharide biosynthesis/export family protein n=1 Tax=Pyxidicoccus parkwayensis TaxID=2813578 RepID=A0ABX7NTF4_9BACT|nr:polysaccharide biosynthesis/export family protein [Pyxidicoccus parkwaysis]QSQ19418.1 polysaccharide biosynthesis/export family protein [Pyxidicoccus parkwaysis]
MPSRFRLAVVLLAALPACFGTSQRPPPPPPTPAAEAGEARAGGGTLGPGDVVEVRVFQEPEHSGTWRVSPEGTIDYPLCGKVPLAGMTPSGAADALQTCLSRYVRRPQVSVLIREYNSQKVFVFGEVQKPGTFPVDGEMSIVQAITLAGGFTKLASKNNTLVTRVVDGQERKIRVPVEDIGVGREKNFMLQPGDIVFVPESFF